MTAYNVKSNSAFAGYDLPKADNTLNGARRFFANWGRLGRRKTRLSRSGFRTRRVDRP